MSLLIFPPKSVPKMENNISILKFIKTKVFSISSSLSESTLKILEKIQQTKNRILRVLNSNYIYSYDG